MKSLRPQEFLNIKTVLILSIITFGAATLSLALQDAAPDIAVIFSVVGLVASVANSITIMMLITKYINDAFNGPKGGHRAKLPRSTAVKATPAPQPQPQPQPQRQRQRQGA